MSDFALTQNQMNVLEKLARIKWLLVMLVVLLAGAGALALYSAAGGSYAPWAIKHILRFIPAFVIMICIALIHIRHWQRFSYYAYALGILLLAAVEIMGAIGMGAQRWINLGFMQLQPSELMKIASIMMLAQYFHSVPSDKMRRLTTLIRPTIFVVVPVGLVMMQPDLGTSLMILMGAAAVYFMAGISLWVFAFLMACGIAAIPLGWFFVLHDYQKQRILTFLDPERDPLGAGYHITQSKIALGSGGLSGKGYLEGTQSHLDFLPEKQTDFIFTLWAEEWRMRTQPSRRWIFQTRSSQWPKDWST